jgi:tRNA threonylcarbamoyl adenosine modification protein YeaZ
VALTGPAGERWGLWTQEAGRRGTAELAIRAGELLEARGLAVADLGGVAVGIGPGSYTGLRAAIAFVRGLTHPGRLPLAGVVSVEAAALASFRAHAEALTVTVVLDARRDECYRADYRRDGAWLTECGAPRLVPAAEIEALGESTASKIIVREPDPEGYDVAALGRRRLMAGGDPPATVLPLYLKRSHAEIALEERARPR